MKKTFQHIISTLFSFFILFALSFCTNSDIGNYDEISIIRTFFQAMSDGNYQKVIKIIHIPDSSQGKMFGVGDSEISVFQKRFPWSGKKLVKVVKMPTSTENECRYELQIESNGVIQKDNLFLVKKNNKWYIALIEQLQAEGFH